MSEKLGNIVKITVDADVSPFKKLILEAVEKAKIAVSYPKYQPLPPDNDKNYGGDPDPKFLAWMASGMEPNDELTEQLKKRLFDKTNLGSAPSMMVGQHYFTPQPHPVPDLSETMDRIAWDLNSYDTYQSNFVEITLPPGIRFRGTSNNLLLMNQDDDYQVPLVPNTVGDIFTVDQIIPLLIDLPEDAQVEWIKVIDQQAAEMEARAAALRIASLVFKGKFGKLPPEST